MRMRFNFNSRILNVLRAIYQNYQLESKSGEALEQNLPVDAAALHLASQSEWCHVYLITCSL